MRGLKGVEAPLHPLSITETKMYQDHLNWLTIARGGGGCVPQTHFEGSKYSLLSPVSFSVLIPMVIDFQCYD
jgi:hypothetical protein